VDQWSLLTQLRHTRSLSTSLRAAAVAFTALALASTPALAAGTIPAGGGMISASGGWSTATGKPDSCSSTEWLFVINGLSSNASRINSQGTVTYHAYPNSISVSFDTSVNVDVPATGVEIFANPSSSNLHYSIPVTAANAQYTLDGATAVFGHSTDGSAMTYSNFVLSHGPCATTPPPPPPPPGATPELDSLVLFGGGAAGLAGYMLIRRRARKRDS